MAVVLCALWLAGVALAAAPYACADDESVMRVRIAWGGGEPTIWSGSIAVDGGRIAEHQALGIEADESGSMWIQDGRLLIAPRSPRQYDGVDISIAGPLTSKLIIALAPPGNATPQAPVEIELASLVDGQHAGRLGAGQNRLLVRRTPGDQLRVRMANPALVFAPGDTIGLEVQPHLLGDIADGHVRLNCRVVGARGDHASWSEEKQLPVTGGRVEPLSLSVPVPETEGVYDLEMTALVPDDRKQFVPGSAFRNRQREAAQRKVQFVVLDTAPSDRPAQSEARQPDRLLMEINPDQPWWKRVTQIPKLPGLGHGPLQNGDVTTWQHPQLGKMVRLPAGAGEPHANWTAYPLSVSQTGQPHILEVEYPSDMPQAMGISILEPNSAGSVLPIGLDSGVYVPASAVGNPPTIERHRLVFWPRSRQPVVLITNRRDDAPAAHGRVRLLGPKTFAVARFGLGGEPESRLPRALPAGVGDDQRMLAAYMERPLIPEQFSATEAFDPWSQRSIDDWQTFYEGGTRMMQYLNYVGYNALVISVMSGGSTIYPSQLLESTPRYDTGVFLDKGQDPLRKDVLEMLFRLCDREGLQLIPALQFNAPLPALEAVLRRGGPDSVGIEIVGADGLTWRQKYPNNQAQPVHYNPLHPRVQQAMLDVVQELLARYGHHSSLAGISIGSSGHSYAFLPGADWCYDATTLAQFARDTRLPLPDQPQQLARLQQQLQQDPLRGQWLQWRAARLHQFHTQLAHRVRAARPGGKLLVAATGILQSADVQQLLRPALPPGAKPLDALLSIGIQPELYGHGPAQDADNIVLLRPQLVAPDFALHRRATALQLDQTGELDQQFLAAAQAGTLLRFDAESVRLPSFDKLSPFGADTTYTMLVPHIVPGGRACRQRFVHSLAALDAPQIVDGGWMLPLGQEESSRDLVAAYRRLPAQPFATVPGEHQPVTVRVLTRGEDTYVYFVNDSPWKCRVRTQLTTDQPVAVEELSGLRTVPPPQAGAWSVDLDSYDLLAVRFRAPNLGLAEVQVALAGDVQPALQRHIQDLVARAAALGKRSAIDVLENPNFEMLPPGDPNPGWTPAGGGHGVEARLVRRGAHGGNGAVRLSSRGNVASLISNPFPAPKTGRISFTVWIKTNRTFKGPLRLAVNGRYDNREFYRFGVARPTHGWEFFEFNTADVPLNDLENLQIRFDLMGSGEVMIDDIAVSDLQFSENERTELSRILTHAHFSLEAGKLRDCARLLDGYWPRFLQQHVAAPSQPVAAEPRPQRQAHAKEDTPAEPSDTPWWRRALPNVLR